MLFENGDWRADLSGDEEDDGGGDDGDNDEFDLTELRRETDALEEKTDVPTKVYPSVGR